MARKKCETAEEIKAMFIKNGWCPDIEFSEVTEEEAEAKGYTSILQGMRRGKKFFAMITSGTIYDESGKVVFYNIPAATRS